MDGVGGLVPRGYPQSAFTIRFFFLFPNEVILSHSQVPVECIVQLKFRGLLLALSHCRTIEFCRQVGVSDVCFRYFLIQVPTIMMNQSRASVSFVCYKPSSCCPPHRIVFVEKQCRCTRTAGTGPMAVTSGAINCYLAKAKPEGAKHLIDL